MNPEEILKVLKTSRASAILRTGTAKAARPAMEAAVRAGFKVIEFTLTTPGAIELIAEFSRKKNLVVGAGTVLSVDEARAAVGAGARFLVSPVVDEAVIKEALVLGVLAMPGTHTPTEMLKAHQAGAQLQKLFPAPGTGPAYVRACLGPLPFLRIVPTNGVDEGNAAVYLEAGAYAVGFTDALFNPGDIEAERFDRIEERGRKLLRAAAKASSH